MPSKKTEEIKFCNNGRIFHGILQNFVVFTFWLFWRREWWPMINNILTIDGQILMILSLTFLSSTHLNGRLFYSYLSVCHFVHCCMSLIAISFFCDGEGRGVAFLLFIYWLIDSLIYLSKMFMHIKNSSQLRQNSMYHCKKFPVTKMTKNTPK